MVFILRWYKLANSPCQKEGETWVKKQADCNPIALKAFSFLFGNKKSW